MPCAKSAWRRENHRWHAAIPPRFSQHFPGCLNAPVRATGAGAITAIVSILVDGDNHNDPVADSARGILDGHLVLDRALADEGRYPPVNPLTSISRLARKAWRGDEEKLVMRLKALIHRYEETRDLRLIGGYRPGTDAELDMAIKQAPVIYESLRQTPEQPPSADAFAELAEAMKAAAGIPWQRSLRKKGPNSDHADTEVDSTPT
jgi:flagellar biosynthesis/type III secretory pathway ATPase